MGDKMDDRYVEALKAIAEPHRLRLFWLLLQVNERICVAEAMDVLNEREKDILTQRRLSEETITLEDLSSQYDVSRERIRQIEVRAFEKLQKRMRDLAKDRGMLANA